eukprot:CAMPEP_0172593612 /NCGR_PEP_ID=MMETSP1068-20121228/12847_1 /TAXON_ID=35684 /ORGANISM="Pseudopedinella elastica, Strain CCMP716" /LENGTH=289 /DNA_ID=CAMNT_0013391233 /DNA_START=191 /DNA_END=1057 /DNA_ORIENTATION=-
MNLFTFALLAWSLKDPVIFGARTLMMAYAFARPKQREAGNFCALCDDFVANDLLFFKEDLDNLECRVICFQREGCTKMCDELKTALDAGTHYPCVSAGYCPEDEEGELASCRLTPSMHCEPRNQCKRIFHKFQVKCELRKGYAEWKKAQSMLKNSAAALKAALKSQLHCGHPDANPDFCVVQPEGVDLYCEWISFFITFLVGTYKSVMALETPGGDDDQQWLCFWIVVSGVASVESFIRVLLSFLPNYYKVKLLFFWWLAMGGAEFLYRRGRNFVMELKHKWRRTIILP